MSYLSNHLDSNEKIIVKKRPSRKAFLPEYVLILLVVLVALGLGVYRLKLWLDTNYALAATFTILFGLTGLIIIILLVKVEYKIWSKRYALTTERILVSTGIFSEKFKSTIYNKITDIELDQTFFDKILNVGTLKLNTAGGDNVEIVLDKISRPFDIKRHINDQQTITNPLVQNSIPKKKA